MKKGILLAAAAVIMLARSTGFAQNDFMIFPQLADGSFPDGTLYRSTLNVSPWFDDANCNLVLYGMDMDLGTGRSMSFSFSVADGGFLSARSTASTPLQTGYATLTCDAFVFGQMSYAFYNASGQKLAEATVFPTEFESFVYEVIVDGRDGAQLAIAIANNTDIQRNYDLILKNADGVQVNAGTTTVPAGARDDAGCSPCCGDWGQ